MGTPDLPADPAELVALASSIADEVADGLLAALDGRAEAPTVDRKSTETDLVTDLDRWAERHITERLLAARPDDGVEGEEGAAITGRSGITWCVDPIDGTVNFVHGLPGFCVSIAARVEGRSIAGSVLSPLHRDRFEATLGGGATRNGRPIRVSSPASLARSVIGTGFAYDPLRRRRQAEVVVQVIDRIADVRRSGAAAVDLCSVACGRLDGYWEVGLNDWDHAAGALIAAEAGATVSVLDGPGRLSYTVAAPPEVYDELHALLASAGAADV